MLDNNLSAPQCTLMLSRKSIDSRINLRGVFEASEQTPACTWRSQILSVLAGGPIQYLRNDFLAWATTSLTVKSVKPVAFKPRM